MHIAIKLIVILNLVVCLILSQYVWIALAENVQWKDRYEIELQARYRDKDALEQARSDLAAVKAANQQDEADRRVEVSRLTANKHALESWRTEARLAQADAEARATELVESIGTFQGIRSGYDQVVSGLQEAVGERAKDKEDLFERRGTLLADVAYAHDEYAELHEAYVRVEFQHFLLQEELERRLDTKARYRWLRPDLQADLGENGPVIFASVHWVADMSVQLDKGRRDGVELHQKYTITRNGTTIAVVDVVELQNETCECAIVDLVNSKVMPKSGDDAVTRLFMARTNARSGD